MPSSGCSSAAARLHRSWLGLGNFERLFADDTFRRAALNTAYFSDTRSGARHRGSASRVALLLNHPCGRAGLFRILLIIPWAIAPVANAVLWKWILNANYGVLNALLKSLGLIDHYQVWLGTPGYGAEHAAPRRRLEVGPLHRAPDSGRPAARPADRSIVPPIWTAPGPSQSFRHVTLPTIRSVIAIAVVLQTIWSLRVFDLVFVLTRGGPADATVLLNFLAYRVTFNFLDLGYGSAIANVIFALTFVLAMSLCAGCCGRASRRLA